MISGFTLDHLRFAWETQPLSLITLIGTVTSELPHYEIVYLDNKMMWGYLNYYIEHRDTLSLIDPSSLGSISIWSKDIYTILYIFVIQAALGMDGLQMSRL